MRGESETDHAVGPRDPAKIHKPMAAGKSQPRILGAGSHALQIPQVRYNVPKEQHEIQWAGFAQMLLRPTGSPQAGNKNNRLLPAR